MIIDNKSLKNQQEYAFIIGKDDVGKRLDKFLFLEMNDIFKKEVEISRVRVQELIKIGKVLRNNEVFTLPSYKVKNGEIFKVIVPESIKPEITPKNIPLDIIFEDDYMLVINKQEGLTTHPGAGNYDNTLVNALLYYCGDTLSGINGIMRPGIVHRLDKDTSGLMVVAKTDKAHHSLSKQIAERTLERRYKCVVWGVLNPKSGKIKGNIIKSRYNRIKMEVSRNENIGKSAITNYETLEIFGDNAFSLLECKLDTGRTHQIRVHLSHLNHPLIGDPLYNKGKKKLPKSTDQEMKDFVEHFSRQVLHSYKIKFKHPISEKVYEFETDLPEDMEKLVGFLRKL
ncbi:RluA family pseudouridine synthase [Pseudomonadota bacterium]